MRITLEFNKDINPKIEKDIVILDNVCEALLFCSFLESDINHKVSTALFEYSKITIEIDKKDIESEQSKIIKFYKDCNETKLKRLEQEKKSKK